MSKALIIIDIQNDYFKGGKYELFEPEKAAKNAKDLLEKFRERNLPVFHIQHISDRPNATFFLPNTDGVKIYDELTPKEGEIVVVKHFPDSFLQTSLQKELENLKIQELIVCGMMSHMCIDTTVRSAAAKGYSVVLAGDACATKDLKFNGETIEAKVVHYAFMAAINGFFADIKTTQELIEQI